MNVVFRFISGRAFLFTISCFKSEHKAMYSELTLPKKKENLLQHYVMITIMCWHFLLMYFKNNFVINWWLTIVSDLSFLKKKSCLHCCFDIINIKTISNTKCFNHNPINIPVNSLWIYRKYARRIKTERAESS